MPLIRIHSTQTPENAEALLKHCSAALAEHLGKPESYVMTCLTPPAAMTFAGTQEPSCFVEVKNIGTMSPDQTRSMSEALCGFLSEGLGVPPSRTYIEFADAERHLWGWDGKTFA